MDFGIFAIAFNLGKLWNYRENAKKKAQNDTKKEVIVIFVFILENKNVWNQKFIQPEERKICDAA